MSNTFNCSIVTAIDSICQVPLTPSSYIQNNDSGAAHLVTYTSTTLGDPTSFPPAVNVPAGGRVFIGCGHDNRGVPITYQIIGET